MKTKNNVQKAILRTGAVIISFVLISLTVSAQDFWKKLLVNSSFNEIALAMTERPARTAGSAAGFSGTSLVAPEQENNLPLENWMFNEGNFQTNFSGKSAVEEALQVEDWMMNTDLFETVRETEPALKVEDWMTSEKVWNR